MNKKKLTPVEKREQQKREHKKKMKKLPNDPVFTSWATRAQRKGKKLGPIRAKKKGTGKAQPKRITAVYSSGFETKRRKH